MRATVVDICVYVGVIIVCMLTCAVLACQVISMLDLFLPTASLIDLDRRIVFGAVAGLAFGLYLLKSSPE